MNCILYNSVEGSLNYGKYALMTDDNHGRVGIHSVDENIVELKYELENLQIDYISFGSDSSWENFSSIPIKCFM